MDKLLLWQSRPVESVYAIVYIRYNLYYIDRKGYLIALHQLELMYGAEATTIVDQVTHYNTNDYHWKLDKLENKNTLLSL
ncbi:MAG: hypothetical protein NQ127_02815 [Candidatus Cardinium sp.]|nr:hypothetical protein [Candidatus Cardinium sp.]